MIQNLNILLITDKIEKLMVYGRKKQYLIYEKKHDQQT